MKKAIQALLGKNFIVLPSFSLPRITYAGSTFRSGGIEDAFLHQEELLADLGHDEFDTGCRKQPLFMLP